MQRIATVPHTADATDPATPVGWALGVAGVVAAAFAWAIGFDFVAWDDPFYLLDNPLVRDPDAHTFTEHLLTPGLGYPVPLTLLSYRLELALVGEPTAWVHHATNIVLHAANAGLVFLVGRRLGLSAWAAAVAALVFGLHPAVAEPACWVTGRKDLLCAFFVLAASGLCLSPGAPPHPRRRDFVIVVLLLAALLSKPVAAFAALLLPLWMYMRGETPRRIALRFWPVVLAVLVLIPVAFMGHEGIEGQEGAGGVSTPRAIWYALGHHLGLVVLAITPAAKYLPEPWPPGFSPMVDLLPFVFVTALAAVYRASGTNRRQVMKAAGLFALLSYLPNSGLVPLTRFLADTYVYLPLMGLSWFVAAGLEELKARSERPTVPILSAGLLVAALLLLLIPSQARWESSLSLWQANYVAYPDDHRLCRNVGNALFETERHAEALAHYEHCVSRFGPEHFEKNVGVTLFVLGRVDDAEVVFRSVLAREPEEPVARRYLMQIGAMRAAGMGANPSAPTPL